MSLDNIFKSKDLQHKPEWLKSLNAYSRSKIESIGPLNMKNDNFKYSRMSDIFENTYHSREGSGEDKKNSICFHNSSIGIGEMEEGVKIFKTEEIENDHDLLNKIMGNEDDNYLTTLNHALIDEVIVIDISKSQKEPLTLIHKTDHEAIKATMVLVRIKKGIKVSIIEKHSSAKKSFQSYQIKFLLESGSEVKHFVSNLNRGISLQMVEAVESKGASFNSFNFSKGGELVRNEILCNFNGEDCSANLYGIYLCSDSHVDNSILIKHNHPNCENRQIFKGILDNRSKGAFSSKVFVKEHSMGSESQQTNKTLILDEESEMNSRPQLEIYNDDVKCGHGSTIGRVDEELIFYLTSRGIDPASATAMLTKAFIDELLPHANDGIRLEVEEAMKGGENQ